MSQQIKETKEEADEALEQAEKEKNSVGEAGLLEGMIPIWGSGRDLIHSIQTGDKVGMALNAAFLVWDVASVAAGVLSFGTATAAMMGAKAGVRTLIKAGGKVALGLAKKKMAALAAKSLALKEGVPAALKAFGKKIPRVCVTACFPAGTPIAVPDGFKNIEDIQVGDLVWAWNEETGDLALKPVVHTMQRISDALVELRIGAEVVRATPEHPFRTAEGWLEAGRLEKGIPVLRSDGQLMPVGEVTHHTEQPTTVYNFEVADWHTYLVSWWMFVVHNATVCLKALLEDALKSADEWAKWAKSARAELREALGTAGTGLHAHHKIPLESLKRNPIVQRAYREGFGFNAKANGKALGVYTHLFLDGELKFHHAPYNRYVESLISEAAKKFPKMPAAELLEKKVMPRVDKFIEQAVKQKTTLSELARTKGF